MVAYGDINVFQTVIRNFFSNAVKFTLRNGKITINANHKNSDAIEISIADTGVGMDDETLNKLFQINETLIERFLKKFNDPDCWH